MNKSTDKEPPQAESDKSYLSLFLEHLDELRKRLVRTILFLIGGMIVCLIFSEQLLEVLTDAFEVADRSQLALLYPTEGFVVRLKVAFVGGLFLTSPLWFAQIWGFVGPGLYANERKAIVPVIAASSVAFILGALFGYWILPYGVHYFQSFATPEVGVSWSLGRYVDFSLRMLVAFGVVFEMPLIVYAAARIGVVTTAQLRKYRRQVIIVVLILSGLITPPDIFTQIVLSIPLIILYETGILLASIAIRRRNRS
ncbi:MAG: twin-arginine translocase subunit TatC [Candidatus Electryoneaceae bacterium]|nr:twin-arginine translocase subunit TatC [Candidatus Electryoneaceae bacterium]